MPTVQPQEFRLFPQLPLELRRAIWDECLPRVRVVEINKPHRAGYIHSRYMPTNDGNEECSHQMTYRLNSIPPVIAAVCRESRQAAGFSVPRDDEWRTKNDAITNEKPAVLWFDRAPSRNIIFLDWDPSCGHYWSARSPLGPFRYLSPVAAHAQTVCVTGEVLHTLFPPLSDRENFRTLWGIKSFLVCQKIVAIHAKIDAATQSGLWGFNGEERIVLVHVENLERIEEYACFNKTFGSEEDGETKGFFQGLVGDSTQWSMQQELLNTWKARFLLGRWHDQQAELGLQKAEDWSVTPAPGLFGVLDSGLENWKLKEDSSWAKATLPAVPQVQWVYMFRLCVDDCHVKTK
ncbi:hypothetical protein BDP81DRAFT_399625 [Colletotrichum phormii]|uniref:2EXR domain-containing protein n=1 Tax=Colletotrichum phormii TaxID=359342 RepID=A0AAI9ZEY6_9PEZI|nr:uncharacterized protein BDP81DRAFT_399625 [Colletotrichum phormii]KAK1623314.1 hypothetical protein BDP81DRAFT_399625 [Colletotrichum phormii]